VVHIDLTGDGIQYLVSVAPNEDWNRRSHDRNVSMTMLQVAAPSLISSAQNGQCIFFPEAQRFQRSDTAGSNPRSVGWGVGNAPSRYEKCNVHQRQHPEAGKQWTQSSARIGNNRLPSVDREPATFRFGSHRTAARHRDFRNDGERLRHRLRKRLVGKSSVTGRYFKAQVKSARRFTSGRRRPTVGGITILEDIRPPK